VLTIRKTFQDRLADASATAEESISNIRTVRSFVAEDKASQLYAESVDKSYLEGKKLAIIGGVLL
jgi:ABC-type multidrug transport system fused ATPase/permease subunit